jgi:hypothetical protein
VLLGTESRGDGYLDKLRLKDAELKLRINFAYGKRQIARQASSVSATSATMMYLRDLRRPACKRRFPTSGTRPGNSARAVVADLLLGRARLFGFDVQNES